MLDGEPWFNKRPLDNRNREVYNSQVLRKYMACMRRSRQDAGRETVAGPRDMTLLGSVCEVFWDSRANDRFKPKGEGFW